MDETLYISCWNNDWLASGVWPRHTSSIYVWKTAIKVIIAFRFWLGLCPLLGATVMSTLLLSPLLSFEIKDCQQETELPPLLIYGKTKSFLGIKKSVLIRTLSTLSWSCINVNIIQIIGVLAVRTVNLTRVYLHQSKSTMSTMTSNYHKLPFDFFFLNLFLGFLNKM